MRDLAPEILTQINLRGAVKVRQLVWIVARNRETGEPETIGISNLEDNYDFVVDGQSRLYYGGGNFLSIGTLRQEKGLVIRKLTVNVSPFTAEMEQLMRGYDTKMARTFIHLAFFNPETDNLLAAPFRVFKGWIDTFPISIPAKGDSGSATMNLVGNSRILTRLFPDKRSDASQKLRSSGDDLFKYVGITGTIQTPWGSK